MTIAGKHVLSIIQKVANAKRAHKWRLLRKNFKIFQEFHKREAQRARENSKISPPIPADKKPAYLANKEAKYGGSLCKEIGT